MYTQDNNFKKELFFSVICIAIYFLSLILANIASNIVIKIPNSINALVEILFPAIILILLRKKKLLSYYGLNSLKKLNYKNLLFCIPMIIIPIVNLCFGIHINYSWKEICQGVNMLRTIFLRYAVTNYFEAADIAVTCMQ